MLTHVEDCTDHTCICGELENFYDLMQVRQAHNDDMFPLTRKERHRYKYIIDD